jgi:hypothetical protein
VEEQADPADEAAVDPEAPQQGTRRERQLGIEKEQEPRDLGPQKSPWNKPGGENVDPTRALEALCPTPYLADPPAGVFPSGLLPLAVRQLGVPFGRSLLGLVVPSRGSLPRRALLQ